ncbi:Quaternary ammonium compound-resistance protein qacE [Nostocoides japonicum T1-X7]|uniref:Quaternary ammonium compound-resistance protein qacE n=1 Tax=Nostocoides japonicum T1-X7 TaxID=1194083 RepID=A0A077M147_9MICO|nr:multidrug efflux SMR transporter [Tetrasphaera japonica]CCH77919.1 Quaternary ammonium compound-resistance protein qacE [Tetrasphaera japonica T1-X7]
MVAWGLLLTAIAVEVGATAVLPRAEGFHNLPWSAVVVVGYGLAIWLLTVVVHQLPVATTYAIWSGLGTAGIAVVGTLFLGERLDPVKLAALALIICGVVLLNVHGTSAH